MVPLIIMLAYQRLCSDVLQLPLRESDKLREQFLQCELSRGHADLTLS